jgi:hypothetical protein
MSSADSGVYADTPRVQAVYAFLAELGLPTAAVKSFEAVVDRERIGNHVTVTYQLASDDPFGAA